MGPAWLVSSQTAELLHLQPLVVVLRFVVCTCSTEAYSLEFGLLLRSQFETRKTNNERNYTPKLRICTPQGGQLPLVPYTQTAKQYQSRLIWSTTFITASGAPDGSRMRATSTYEVFLSIWSGQITAQHACQTGQCLISRSWRQSSTTPNAFMRQYIPRNVRWSDRETS